MDKIYLIDFDDSFTYNIASEIYLNFNKEVEIVNFKKFTIDHPPLKKNDILILGPGPGHPLDYKENYPVIKNILETKKNFVVGICLGHQIIWKIKGAEVIHSSRPLHGHTVLLKLDFFWKKYFDFEKEEVEVQRYNSLVVDKDTIPEASNQEFHCLYLNNELMASQGEHFLSFQFHPESIGTEHRKKILRCMLRQGEVK